MAGLLPLDSQGASYGHEYNEDIISTPFGRVAALWFSLVISRSLGLPLTAAIISQEQVSRRFDLHLHACIECHHRTTDVEYGTTQGLQRLAVW